MAVHDSGSDQPAGGRGHRRSRDVRPRGSSADRRRSGDGCATDAGHQRAGPHRQAGALVSPGARRFRPHRGQRGPAGGTSLDAVVQYIAKDSTYGPLHRFLHGQAGVRDMQRRRRGARPDQRLRQGDRRPARGPRPQGHPLARQRRVARGGVHRHASATRTPRPTPPGARCAATWPPAPGRGAELAVQEQAEGRPAARRRGHPHPRHQRLQFDPPSTGWSRRRRARPRRWPT
jgi:hypothetical protein